MDRLAELGRIHVAANSLRYRRFAEDFPFQERGNIWTDTLTGNFTEEKLYVVQTNLEVVKRCLLMTTDPGDLIFDPTCGSGTSAIVAEQWGRRWITTDTSRIAINIAKTRLMTASLPYYLLHDQESCDLRQGFVYEKAKRIKLGALANDEEPEIVTLYDKPNLDKKPSPSNGTVHSRDATKLRARFSSRAGKAAGGQRGIGRI